MKTLTITDANIFIDLFELDLIPLLFQIDLAIHTTKEILLECDEEQRIVLKHFIQKELLTIHILSDSEFSSLRSLDFNRGLSEQDQGILFLALQQEAMVLTGDNLIRKWCLRNHLEVHGILWVLNQFVETNLFPPEAAISKLKILMQVNSWLPTKACDDLLKEWNKHPGSM